MDILIIADFCGDLDGKGNFRFPYIANLLSFSHQVELLTSDFNHAAKSYFNSVADYPFKITMLHESSYKKNISLRRFYSHFSWGREVKKYLQRRSKPDVVYCAVPTLTAAHYAALYCKKYNIKFITDIQDLWPEAFQMVFDIPIISSLLFLPFKTLANSIYKKADVVVAVSDTYVERVKYINKKAKTFKTVFLGTDLDSFDENKKTTNDFIKPDNEIWLGYCGTLAASYDLTTVIDAVVSLNNPNVKFIVMGDGGKRNIFEAYAKAKNANVIFTGNLPYVQMCSLLCKCDITVNPIVKGSAASIINKHSDYAACGLPVLNTQDSVEYRDLVKNYNMGFNCNNGDATDLANKLNLLISNRDLRLEMGYNSRKCAEEKFNRNYTYNIIVDLIEN